MGASGNSDGVLGLAECIERLTIDLTIEMKCLWIVVADASLEREPREVELPVATARAVLDFTVFQAALDLEICDRAELVTETWMG